MLELARIAGGEEAADDLVEQSKARAREAFARRHEQPDDSTDLGGVRIWNPTHCQDYPLCGHDEGGCP
jgi:hypothetical protein